MGQDISQCKSLITTLGAQDLKIPVSIALEWKTEFINCLKALEVNREKCESFLGSETNDDGHLVRIHI